MQAPFWDYTSFTPPEIKLKKMSKTQRPFRRTPYNFNDNMTPEDFRAADKAVCELITWKDQIELGLFQCAEFCFLNRETLFDNFNDDYLGAWLFSDP